MSTAVCNQLVDYNHKFLCITAASLNPYLYAIFCADIAVGQFVQKWSIAYFWRSKPSPPGILAAAFSIGILVPVSFLFTRFKRFIDRAGVSRTRRTKPTLIPSGLHQSTKRPRWARSNWPCSEHCCRPKYMSFYKLPLKFLCDDPARYFSSDLWSEINEYI